MAPKDFYGAVAADVFDTTRDDLLAAYLDASRDRARPGPDDAGGRLISGFKDFFISIGIVLVFGVLGRFGGACGVPLVAFAAWGLAEVFTRRKRMALSSILLSLSFVWASGQTAAYLLIIATGVSYPNYLPVGVQALTMLCVALLHFRRFRVPIDVSLVAMSALLASCALVAAVASSTTQTRLSGAILLIVYGLGIFALAMRYDMSDPRRETSRADIGFWLHLIAPPLFFLGVLGGLVQSGAGAANMSVGSAVTVLFVGACVGLLVDRRVTVVSSMAYVALMIVWLHGPMSASQVLAFLSLGVAVLALNLWWRPLRAMTLALAAG